MAHVLILGGGYYTVDAEYKPGESLSDLPVDWQQVAELDSKP